MAAVAGLYGLGEDRQHRKKQQQQQHHQQEQREQKEEQKKIAERKLMREQHQQLLARASFEGIPPSFLTILAGTTNRTADSVIKDVVKVIPHPEFSAYDNDIALLKLNDSLQFNDLIQPIPIASVNAPVDAPVTISGWGRTKEGGEITSQLMYNKYMKTLSPENCAKNIGYNTTAILCLSKFIGNGICEGDDGGPAVYRGILIGVASFHITDCYSTNKPNGFANVSHFNSWLTQAQICNP